MAEQTDSDPLWHRFRSLKAAIGIPRWKFSSEWSSDVGDCHRNVAGRIARVLVNTYMAAPIVNKALALAIHTGRARRVVEFVEGELARGYGNVDRPGMFMPASGSQWIVIMSVHFHVDRGLRFGDVLEPCLVAVGIYHESVIRPSTDQSADNTVRRSC